MMNKIILFWKKACSFFKQKILIILPSKYYLKIVFKKKMGYELNLKNPVTFNEKIQWLKLYNHDKRYVSLTDKYEVKKIVSKIIGEKYVIPTYGVYDDFDDIDFSSFQENITINCTHDNGNRIRYPKDNKNIKNIRDTINNRLNHNYFFQNREWSYRDIKPRIIVEKDISNGKNMRQYQLFSFNGAVKFFSLSIGDNVEEYYDTNIKPLSINDNSNNKTELPKKMKNIKFLIEISQKLAKDIPFVRIDYYEIGGHIFFDKMSFYHNGDIVNFNSKKWDDNIGKMIKLDKCKKNMHTKK